MFNSNNLFNIAQGAVVAGAVTHGYGFFNPRPLHLISAFPIASFFGVIVPTLIHRDIRAIEGYVAGVFFTNLLASFIHYKVGFSTTNSFLVAGILIAALTTILTYLNAAHPHPRVAQQQPITAPAA